MIEWTSKGGGRMRQEILGAKLEELDAAMEELRARTERVQREEPEAIRAELEALKARCAQDDEALRRCASESRLPDMREMARAELELSGAAARFERLLGQSAQDGERTILCAEFAIDFARLAALHAQLAALIAICGEIEEKGEPK